MKIQCCVCKKVQQKGGWVFSPGHDDEASHTYCPACARDAWAEIRAFKECYTQAQAARRVRAGSRQELLHPMKPL